MSVNGSRFTLVTAPASAPGNDIVTKTDVGPFIDTNYNLKFMEWKTGNRIYLAVSTVREMADVAGLFDDTEQRVEEARQAGYVVGYAEGVKENFNADISDVVDRLGNIVDALRGGALPDGPPPVEVAPPVAKPAAAAKPRAARAAGQGARSGGQRGRADVPAVAGDESGLGI